MSLAVAAGALGATSHAAGPGLKTVAAGLNNPRKLSVGPDGSLYVAEAGAGGRDRCLGKGPDPTCIGLTGSITRITGGSREQVVVGLPSIARATEQRAAGPTAVRVDGGTYTVLLQDAYVNAHGGNALGRDGRTAGTLVSTPPGKAKPTVIADLAAFEARHNPDRGAGPGTRFGNPPVDSDPYAFVRYSGGYAVVDAAGNDLLRVAPDGAISVLTVFPTRTVQLTAAERKRYAIPAGVRSLAVQSVPTCVAPGPDGALYVGELTGLPFRQGLARIWRVTPAGKKSLYASGFSTISDLAFDGKDLLVLELAAAGIGAQRTHGALIRLEPGGRRTVLASTGLVDPTGVAVAGGSIYVSNYGTYPGAGPGPHGEVVRLATR